ncbi:MAG: hypothetical protein ABR964_03950 [Tepidisphaeraceae bacterium]
MALATAPAAAHLTGVPSLECASAPDAAVAVVVWGVAAVVVLGVVVLTDHLQTDS